MMRKVSLLGLSLVSLLLVGCATTQNYSLAVNSWQGGNVHSLFKTWGYPNRILTLPHGHRLYIYSYRDHGETPSTVFPGYTTISQRHGTTFVSSTPPMVMGGTEYDMRCTTWFEANKQGRIVGTSFRGNSCSGTQSFAQDYSNPARMTLLGR